MDPITSLAASTVSSPASVDVTPSRRAVSVEDTQIISSINSPMSSSESRARHGDSGGGGESTSRLTLSPGRKGGAEGDVQRTANPPHTMTGIWHDIGQGLRKADAIMQRGNERIDNMFKPGGVENTMPSLAQLHSLHVEIATMSVTTTLAAGGVQKLADIPVQITRMQ